LARIAKEELKKKDLQHESEAIVAGKKIFKMRLDDLEKQSKEIDSKLAIVRRRREEIKGEAYLKTSRQSDEEKNKERDLIRMMAEIENKKQQTAEIHRLMEQKVSHLDDLHGKIGELVSMRNRDKDTLNTTPRFL